MSSPLGRILGALLALAILGTQPTALAQESDLLVRARVVHDFVLDGELSEWGAPQIVLDEKSLITSDRSDLSRRWAGPDDLSGEFWVGYTATKLVLAGRVRDDISLPNPRIWWLGDEIEVFLDLDLDPDEPNPNTYDDDDLQLLLFPRAEGRKWGFSAVRGKRGHSDGGFDGVRVSQAIPDEDGRSYTFEAEIPLVNFPELSVSRGTTIGFDLALVDADESAVQKTYMTASGRADLAVDPSRFGRLVFEEDLPSVPAPRPATVSSWAEPVAILLGALIVLFLLWRFRHALTPITELPVKTKLLLILPLVGLLVLAHVVPLALRMTERTRSVSTLKARATILAAALAEVRKQGLLGDGPAGADGVWALLTESEGQAAPRERFEYHPLWIRRPTPSETLGRTPVIDYARRLTPGERADFVTSEPVAARAVSLVYEFEPDLASATRRPLLPDAEIALVRIVLAESGEVVERTLRYGQEIHDGPAPGEPGAHSGLDFEVAWKDADAGTHADELRLSIEPPRAVLRVEFVQLVDQGTFVANGATLFPPEPDPPVPLGIGATTKNGVPTNLWEDRPRGSAATLGPDSEPLVVELDPPVDRVWVFYAQPGQPSGKPEGRSAGDVVSLSLLDEDGSELTETVLESGTTVDAEQLYAEHPAEFRGVLAFRWTPQGGYAHHRDLVALQATGARRLRISHRGRGPSFLVAGITQGRLLPHVPALGLDHLTYDPDTGAYRLAGEARLAIQGLELTWHRADRAERTTFAREEGRAAVLGSSLRARAPDAGVFTRSLGETEHLSAFFNADAEGRQVLEISLPIPGPGRVERAGGVAFYVLLALLLLAALLVIADLLYRLARIRTKITLGFAVAALLPLSLFFFGLSGILEREVGRTQTSTLLEQVGLVKRKIHELRDEVRRYARALGDELMGRPPGASLTEYLGLVDAEVREVAARPSPFPGPIEVFVEDAFPVDGDRTPRVFPLGETEHPFLPFSGATDDLTYQWSRMFLQGVASRAVEGGRRSVAVELPLSPDLLAELKRRFGQRFELLLYTLRGHPYSGTLELSGEMGVARTRERGQIAEEIDRNGRPSVRDEILTGVPHSVAYDLVRTSRGEPVALLGVALPRRELIAARAEIRNLFLILGAVILVLEVIVGNILTRRITDPLTLLSRGARAVTRGKLNTRVAVTASDEIGDLAGSFNRMTEELGRRIEELSKLNAGIRAFSGSLDQELVLERAVAAFREAGTLPDGLAIALRDDDGVRIAAGYRGKQPLTPARLPLGDGLLKTALEASAPEVLRKPPAESSSEAERKVLGRPGSVAVIPLHPGRESRGAVLLLFRGPDPELTPGDLEFLSTLAQQVAIALENARLYQLAIEDAATGLYVHSYFLARLREETDRALAAGRPLSLLLLSMDEVPRVYETYGPAEGDHLMKQAVRRLRGATHGMHILGRADRETIEVLLPEAGKDDALAVARGYREALRLDVPLEGDPNRAISLTPAIGLSTCPDDARSADFLLAAANQALYMAVRDRAGSSLVDVGRERERIEARVKGQAGPYVFHSQKMVELLETVDRIAESDVPILIQGETGTGKEVIADIIHQRSGRQRKPLVKLNCAALPETLLESELFGYERGAFTGADRMKPGRFELADGGTIFLDEVGEMPPQTQVKLLRVLQDHRLERLGGTEMILVDVRIIAATNMDLLAAIREGRFREDLFFRLNVVSLAVPPLRARREEIPALVDHFVARYRAAHRTTGRRLSPAAMDRLFSHTWPGNVRELRNTIERALVIARGEEVHAEEIAFPKPAAEEPPAETAAAAPAPAPEARLSGLNARQRKLLEMLSRRDSITNREYVNLVGVSSRTGNRDLGELVDRGIIEQIGRRRGAVYRLSGR